MSNQHPTPKEHKMIKATLKAKAKINCETCGETLRRVKSFGVEANNIEDAKAEVAERAASWRRGLFGTNCKCCQTIINSH